MRGRLMREGSWERWKLARLSWRRNLVMSQRQVEPVRKGARPIKVRRKGSVELISAEPSLRWELEMWGLRWSSPVGTLRMVAVK